MSDTQRQRVTLLGTRSLEPRCVATSLDLNLCDVLCYFPDQFVKLALELVNLILQIIYLSLNTGHFSPCADANGLLWKSARAFLVFSRAYAPSCISSFGCVAGSLPLRAASIAAMFRFISSSLSFSMRARVLASSCLANFRCSRSRARVSLGVRLVFFNLRPSVLIIPLTICSATWPGGVLFLFFIVHSFHAASVCRSLGSPAKSRSCSKSESSGESGS